MPEHRWPKRVLEWEPPGRRRRGRPALRWETYSYIGQAMIDRDLRVGDWNVKELWRKKTANSQGKMPKKKKRKISTNKSPPTSFKYPKL
nr:unnamed protein product [Callosobruchus chinensis]